MKEIFNFSEVRTALKEIIKYLTKYKILSPQYEAELLISAVTGFSKTEIYLNKSEYNITDQQKELLSLFLQRRASGEPLSYILGFKEFFGLKFKVNRSVFIPRFETELIVEKILKLNCKNLNILDIGTGCGNISVALKKNEKSFNITALDISLDALKVAKENSNEILGNGAISFICSDLFENVSGKFDIIVSNPPYILSKEIELLSNEVKEFEPRIAIDGGVDGLFFYKKILE